MKTFRIFLLISSVFFASACLVYSQSALSEGTITEGRESPIPERLPGETATPTTFPCPLATPEPLWVNPVLSPTTLLTQTIVVFIGNGEYVSVSGVSGIFTETGNFDAFNFPANVQIDLLANTRHHLEVSARVKQVEQDGCVYGGYTLFTNRDREGNPLSIDQISFLLYLPYAARESHLGSP